MRVLVFQHFAILQVKMKTWKFIPWTPIVGDAFSVRESNKTIDRSLYLHGTSLWFFLII